MSYKIIITDNETGEVLVNENKAKAIVGAYVNGESTGRMGFTKCNAMDLEEVISGAESVAEKLKSKHPFVAILSDLKKVVKESQTSDMPNDIMRDKSSIFDIDIPEESRDFLSDYFKNL